VRKIKGDDALEIRLHEVLSDVTHDMGAPEDGGGLVKDGVERDLQELLADQPGVCGEGFRLVRREWPTDIGPVDLMCRDDEDGWIAVEIKRVATIDAVEQLYRYLERIQCDPAMGDCRGVLAAQVFKPQARVWPPRAASAASRSTLRCCAASVSPTSRCSSPEPRPQAPRVAVNARSVAAAPVMTGPCPKPTMSGSSASSLRIDARLRPGSGVKMVGGSRSPGFRRGSSRLK
jgi:hypothetical protein